MWYVTLQMLNKVNAILDNKLGELTWKDKMNWKENNFFYDYNLAKIIAVKEVKAIESILE